MQQTHTECGAHSVQTACSMGAAHSVTCPCSHALQRCPARLRSFGGARSHGGSHSVAHRSRVCFLLLQLLSDLLSSVLLPGMIMLDPRSSSGVHDALQPT